jgi:hypothetical protein
LRGPKMTSDRSMIALRAPRWCSNPALRVVPAKSGRPDLKMLTGQHLAHLMVCSVAGHVENRPVFRALVKAEREWSREGTCVLPPILGLIPLNHIAFPTRSAELPSTNLTQHSARPTVIRAGKLLP